MNNQTQLTVYDWLGKLPGAVLAIVSAVILVAFAFYVLNILKKVRAKETEIFDIKDQKDNLEQTLVKKMNGYANQSQLEKMVERDRKPLDAKLEKLKMERQFLLDRVSIFGLIKK